MGISHLQQKTGFAIFSANTAANRSEYVTLVDKNGLIQVVPRISPKRGRKHTSLKLVAALAVLVTLFKAAALVNVGYVDYNDELALLANGNVVEKAGAFIFQIDPVTEVISKNLGSFLN